MSSSDFTYEDLFLLIKKNTKLKNAIDAVDPNNAEYKSLLTAIHEGQDSEIFKKPECHVFLLRLFKDNLITPSVFLSAYNYWMAQTNFANNNSFKTPSLVSLIKDNELTDAGKDYIKLTSEKFKELFNINIDKDQLEIFLKTLNPIEQCVIHLESNYNSKTRFKLLDDSILITPSYAKKQGTVSHSYRTKGNYMLPSEEVIEYNWITLFPSYALQNYFLAKYFKEPMQFAPRFGSIGNESLLTLHSEGKHIFPLYSEHVASNLIKAHNVTEGCFSNAKHDEGHVILGSFLLKETRDNILKTDVPSLLRLREKIESNPAIDKKFIKTINDMMFDQLNDLTAYPVYPYLNANPQKQRDLMIIKACRFDSGHEKNNDELFIVLLAYYTGDNKELWEAITRERAYLIDSPNMKKIMEQAKTLAQEMTKKYDPTLFNSLNSKRAADDAPFTTTPPPPKK